MKVDLIFVFSVRGIQLNPYDMRKTEAFKDKLNRKTENILLELVGWVGTFNKLIKNLFIYVY